MLVKGWLIDAMTVMMAVSLAACTPTTEKQKRQTAQAAKDTQRIVPQSIGGAGDKVPDPNVMPIAVVSIYHGGDSDSLVQDMDFLGTGELDTQPLISKLIEYGVLTQGTKALSFDTQGKEEDSVGALDPSQAENTEGVSDEMSLTETDNTLIRNFELGKLKLKVNGENYQSSSTRQRDSDFLSYRTDCGSIEQIKMVYETAPWQRVPQSGLII